MYAAATAAGLALLVVLAALAVPATAKKGGIPAHLAAPVVAPPAVAPAPVPASTPPGQAKVKPAKSQGKGHAKKGSVPVAPAPAPVAAPAAAPARAVAVAAPPTPVASATPSAPTVRTIATTRARHTVRRRSSAPAAPRRAPAAAGFAVAAAGRAAAPAAQASPRGVRRQPKADTPRSLRRSVESLFTPPSVRDVAGVSPAVTRLVEVIPTFVWVILAALALLAAVLAAAVAIAARRLRRAAEREQALAGLALTDPLTGLMNRRGIEAHISSELGRAIRYGGALAVVFGDLRALKTINDRHGHDAGDRALQMVADVLRTQIREGDACGRVGGDEYAVALANQGEEGADAFVGRVRSRLRQTPVPGAGAPGLDFTMGVALFPRDGDTPEDLLTAADRDLYAQRGISVGAD